jgi:O-antigen ligase
MYRILLIMQNLKHIYYVFFVTPILVTLVFTTEILQGYPLLKLCFLATGTSCLLILVMLKRKELEIINVALNLWPVLFYFLTVFIITINTNQKFDILFFGANGRYTGLIYILLIFLYFIISFYLAKPGEIITLTFKSVSLLGLILSLIGYLNLIQNSENNLMRVNSFKLSFNNTNFSSFFLSISFILTCYLLYESKIILQRLYLFSSSLLQFFAIIIINDVQGIIYLCLGIAFYFFVTLKHYFPYNWNLKSVKGFISIFPFLILGTFLFLKILSWTLKINSFQDRLYLWQSGYKIFQDNWLFGVGLNSYGDWEPRYRLAEHNLKLGLSSQEFSLDPHNFIVQSLSTGGIVLFIGYFLLVTYITFKALLGLKNNHNSIRYYTLLLVWFIFLLKQLVSVDNLATDLWGWILAAYLLKLSTSKFNYIKLDISVLYKKIVSYFAYFITTSIVLFSTFFIINHTYMNFSTISKLKNINSYKINSQQNSQVEQIVQFSRNIPSLEIRIIYVKYLLQLNQINGALEMAKYTTLDFPNRGEGWQAVATIYSDLGDFKKADTYMSRFRELRPLDSNP